MLQDTQSESFGTMEIAFKSAGKKTARDEVRDMLAQFWHEHKPNVDRTIITFGMWLAGREPMTKALVGHQVWTDLIKKYARANCAEMQLVVRQTNGQKGAIANVEKNGLSTNPSAIYKRKWQQKRMGYQPVECLRPQTIEPERQAPHKREAMIRHRSRQNRGAILAKGKSTLGIPKKVAKEFVAADKPGKLPAKVKAVEIKNVKKIGKPKVDGEPAIKTDRGTFGMKENNRRSGS
jgi:hypothetical protein